METNYNPKEIQQLIKLLQQMLPKDNQENSESSEDFVESKIKTKSVRADKISNKKNKFLDMPEKNMHKSDTAIDKKLSISPPTPRNRKFISVKVKCRICGKEEKANPAIVPEPADRYKCNNCSTSAGA
jgi:hypothetical protein